MIQNEKIQEKMAQKISDYLNNPTDQTFIENILKKRSISISPKNSTMEMYVSSYFILEAPSCRAIGRYYYYAGIKRFIVHKGSTARSESKTNLIESGKSYVNKKSGLVKTGKLKEAGENMLILTTDIEFNSPSEAATIMTGTKRSGPKDWTECFSGKSFAEWGKSPTYSFYCKMQIDR
jgi:hypothetical protein